MINTLDIKAKVMKIRKLNYVLKILDHIWVIWQTILGYLVNVKSI